MNTEKFAALPTGAKFFLGFTVIFGVIRLLEFIFDGQELHYLLGALGWFALGYGAFRNGYAPKSQQSRAANIITIVGIVFLTVSFALKYFFK